MRILIVIIVISVLMTGCITTNPCHYCGMKTQPTYERNSSVDIGDGYVKKTHTKVWITVTPKNP